VRRVLSGQPDEYAVLVRRYKDVLYRYAERMMGRPDDAEDIVQQAFVKGFQSLDRCRDPEKVGGWLFRIAVNLCKDNLAFVLKHVEGWSYEEMSERLDVSVSALKMRVHRAREELQVLLQRYR
jgi:RNA polymerase sigma-70 factor (ECF subfamily)